MKKNYDPEKARTAFKKYKDDHGLAVKSWCEAADVKQNAVYNFLNGGSDSLSLQILVPLAAVQKTSVEVLVGLREEDVERDADGSFSRAHNFLRRMTDEQKDLWFGFAAAVLGNEPKTPEASTEAAPPPKTEEQKAMARMARRMAGYTDDPEDDDDDSPLDLQ